MAKLSLLALITILACSNASTFEESCSSLSPNSLYDRGICYIISTTTALFSEALCPTNHLGEGQLALVTGQRLYDLVQNWLWGLGVPHAHVGLKQFETGVEPAGGWYWFDKGGNRWDATNTTIWWPGEPDNDNNAWSGCIVTTPVDGRLGLHDCYESARRYLCEYSASLTKFKSLGNIRDGGTVIEEFHDVDMHACGKKCHTTALCHSFSYSKNQRHCLLHMVDAEDISGATDPDYMLITRA